MLVHRLFFTFVQCNHYKHLLSLCVLFILSPWQVMGEDRLIIAPPGQKRIFEIQNIF
jgi:hypothetical protein